ncbi:SphA family protein [Aliivibrio sifiae]|uniref:SphA family protein n=1 Tax=Aliivibrio sifiae TaxID=566293 RepID=UPI003D0A92D3
MRKTESHFTLKRTALITFMSSLYCTGLIAEEGGSGHYMPGSMSSFVDGIPDAPAFIARLNILTYEGDYERSIPISGLKAADIKVKSQVLGLTMVYRPDFEIGDNWSYAFGGTIPFVDIEVSASVENNGQYGAKITESDSGLGDVMLMPVMLNQKISQDLNLNYRVSVYAPTGDYQVGRLANTGKNFWTIEPTVAAVYVGKENGIEASIYAGMDFNTENNDTHYKSGIQAHIETTLAQHFPLFGGLAGVGATGFYYQQLTGDSGSGANFGDFKAKSLGAGPTLSFVHAMGKAEILAELKWLHEFETKRRVQGDTIFLKAMAKF